MVNQANKSQKPNEPSQTSEEPKKRKRGAPRGNRNAVKYGFYSKKTMRHLNYNPAKDSPEVLMREVERLGDVFHQIFAKVTPQSSLADMIQICRLLFYTNTAFNHLISAVYHPAKHSEPKGEELTKLKETNVYDWDVILDRLENLPLNRPDPIFPPSPFNSSRTSREEDQ